MVALLNPFNFALPDPEIMGTVATTQITSASATHSVNLPTGIVAGETLLLMGGTNNLTTTISALSGWTSIYNSTGGFLWKKTATGSEGATVSVGLSSSAKGAYAVARLKTATGQIEAAGINDSDSASLSPSWGTLNTLWLVFEVGYVAGGGSSGTVNPSCTTPYTLVANVSHNLATDDPGFGLGSRGVVTQASEDPASNAVLSGGTRFHSLTIAVHP